jgi:hypothetical protein
MSKDNVASSFKGHHEEIRRRSDVHTKEANASFERRKTDAADLPFVMNEHAVVLFSVSHVGMSPFAESASEPAVRFYGAFATSDDCLDQARVVQQFDAGCNLQMAHTHTWTVMASTPERLADDATCRQHVDALLRKMETSRASATDEFSKNVEKHVGGESEPDREANPTRTSLRILPSSKLIRSS